MTTSLRCLAAILVLAVASACSVPPADAPAPPPAEPPTSASSTPWGPGDTCADTYLLDPTSTRTAFSLASENYKNNDFCGAYPYLKWLLATDPLFTGEDPDDRNFLRMAGVYEQFALEADSAERRVWLDSALATRQEGREAMDAAGIEYETYLRDLVEGFFYFSHAPYYDDAEQRWFDAYTRAFEAEPDSLPVWYLLQLLTGSATEFGEDIPNPERADFVERLAFYVGDAATQQEFMAFAEALRTAPPEPVAAALTDAALTDLVATFRAGDATCPEVLALIRVAVEDPDRLAQADVDPAALQSELLRDACIEPLLTNPSTLAALAFQSYRAGETAEGDRLFDRALAAATSNTVRADLLYARATKAYRDADADLELALRYDPAHGPSRFARLRQLAARVGQPSTVPGRVDYWCLADRFRQLAATTANAEIARLSRDTAARYERSAPTREEVFFALNAGPGDSVACTVSGGTTRIR